jgi:hypothetical protein
MSAVVQTITNPTTGDVVHAMCEFAWNAHSDLTVRELCEDIIRECQSGDYVGYAIAIYRWTCEHIQYVPDPLHVEWTRWPIGEGHGTLDRRSEDCDGISCALAAMLMSVGARCEFCLASFGAHGIPSHVFVSLVTPHGRMALDPVANRETRQMLRDMVSCYFVDVEAGVDSVDGLKMMFNGWHGWRR